MASMDKKSIERQYKTYEEIAKAFGFPGSECTEIYLYGHSRGQNEPSHYKMIRRPDEKASLFSSGHVHNIQLAWSKSKGAVVPYPATQKIESLKRVNNSNTAEIIEPDNLSVEFLRMTLVKAGMDVVVKKNRLLIHEQCTVALSPNPEKALVTLACGFGFNEKSSRTERLDYANEINAKFPMVRAWATDVLGINYFIYLDVGLPKKALVLGIKRFARIVKVAIGAGKSGIINSM